MNSERLELLKDYIKTGTSPLLIENIPTDIFNNSVIIDANIDDSELNGHYEDDKFCPPPWYNELIKKSSDYYAVLIINNINSVDINKQNRFIEILKYNKVSTFNLPKNSLVVVTCNNLDKNKISEEVYSLLVYI